ncbi:uncharacterized protein LOC131859039 [Cryptomeria japonica]|uniref:uncharacterized protein LOC131859039 n=1 Tax=Cryptomeria japonica TaxID=3369 RepID=UPI0027DA6BDF|nr:uncharacterized protein LOC131859039 [Cryptomeria japonica]
MPEQTDLVSKLGTWKQHIEYESIPFACFHYKKAGHWAKSCPIKPKAESRQPEPHSENQRALEKMVWQVKNLESKEENSNCFNPLGEKKEVPLVSISSPTTQEALRNDSTIVNLPITSQTREQKDQTNYPNDIVEVVVDTCEGNELQEKNDQPEEGEIPASQEEKTDSSLLMSSLEIQEAQKCSILGLNLSDLEWSSKLANSDLNDSNASRTPNWGNEEEICKILSNPVQKSTKKEPEQSIVEPTVSKAESKDDSKVENKVETQSEQKEEIVDKEKVNDGSKIAEIASTCKVDDIVGSIGKLDTLSKFISSNIQSIDKINQETIRERVNKEKVDFFNKSIEDCTRNLDSLILALNSTILEFKELYRDVCKPHHLTTDIDDQIKQTQKEIDDIADNLIGSSKLTSILDQEMIVYEEKIENIEKEKARLRLKARELKNKLGPRLDNLLTH